MADDHTFHNAIKATTAIIANTIASATGSMAKSCCHHGRSCINIGLSFQDQQPLARITLPSLPTTSLVEQQGPWPTQRPGFTIEAVTSNTGSSFSTLEQHLGTSAQQQGPLLQVPPVGLYTKYLQNIISPIEKQ